MSLATLFNLITNEETKAEFSFSNQDSHILVCDQLYRVFGIQIPQYILNPIPPDTNEWSLNHQASHNAINSYLGVAGQDYTGIDFSDDNAMKNWIQNHADEHRTWHDILRIEVPVVG